MYCFLSAASPRFTRLLRETYLHPGLFQQGPRLGLNLSIPVQQAGQFQDPIRPITLSHIGYGPSMYDLSLATAWEKKEITRPAPNIDILPQHARKTMTLLLIWLEEI